MASPDTPPADRILICGLDLPTRIGVPEEERAGWQTLQADVTLCLAPRFEAMADEVANTVDYQMVAEKLRQLAASRPRKLIETLASEMAANVLESPPVTQVRIQLRKRILPGTDHVSVEVVRDRS